MPDYWARAPRASHRASGAGGKALLAVGVCLIVVGLVCVAYVGPVFLHGWRLARGERRAVDLGELQQLTGFLPPRDARLVGSVYDRGFMGRTQTVWAAFEISAVGLEPMMKRQEVAGWKLERATGGSADRAFLTGRRDCRCSDVPRWWPGWDRVQLVSTAFSGPDGGPGRLVVTVVDGAKSKVTVYLCWHRSM